MIISHKGVSPDISQAAYIAPSADIIGEVTLGSNVSVWFNSTIRGDLAPVTIGDNSNIQDNAVIHVSTGIPTVLGSNVTAAHSAVLHGCTIGDFSLIGMNATVLDGAVIQEECMVAAGALVPPNKTYPPRSLILGTPARAVRTLTHEEIASLHDTSWNYIKKAGEFSGNQ